ncbi:MAG: type II secretion system GspH family protein [Actinomycetota bacterium]|nr:type II secretion system GspH family protein [Actinomycetota bacterium]
MKARFPGLQREDAFTLVELIIGMVIVGLLVGAIGSALVVSLRTTDVTSARFNESHDAQISSAYLANDVQSAASVAVPGGSNCTASSRLVDFNYASGTASYFCGPSGGETQVTRSYGGQTVVVAHFAGTGRPTVTCFSTPPSPCSATGTGPGSTPDQVTIGFTEASGFSYTLVGSKRLSASGSTSGTGSSGTVTLLVLGGGSQLWVSGSCPPGQISNPGNPNNLCTSDSESGGGQPTLPKLTVYGNLFVNSTTTGAVRLSGKKSSVKLDVEGGDFKILTGGTCSGCTNQTLVCPACTTTPPPGSYSPALLDPLRFMAAPDETGLSHFSDGNYHGPGVYDTRTLTISSATTFAAGTYVLNNGISVTGSSTISGSGVMLYNKIGGISFGGTSTISLSPPTSGQYKGILMFQARTNTTAMSLAGGTGVSPVGIIYAPSSSGVTLGTGSAAMHVTAIVVAGAIKVGGSAQVTIGCNPSPCP